MRKWLRVLIVAIGCAISLVMISWLLVAWYARNHREEIIGAIRTQLQEQFTGQITINDLDLSVTRHFPLISVTCSNLVVRDSLWQRHRHDLIHVSQLIVHLNALSLVRKPMVIRSLKLSNALFYLYTDSNGYSNTHALSSSRPGRSKQQKKFPEIRLLEARNVSLIINDRRKKKLFHINCQQLSGSVNKEGQVISGLMETQARIHQLTFNETKGSFLRNQQMKATLRFTYHQKTATLNIPKQNIQLNQAPILLGATFQFDQLPYQFNLEVAARDISFAQARSLLSPSIGQKLMAINLEKPLDIQASIKGRLKFRDTPRVVVHWQVKDNELHTPGGLIRKASFRGSFDNEFKQGQGFTDANAAIQLPYFSGTYYTIPFKATNVLITNLLKPQIAGTIQSECRLKQLNEAIGSGSFRFDGGTASLNIEYKAGLTDADTSVPIINGFLQVHNAAFTYLPRNLHVNRASMKLEFSASDLLVKNAFLQIGHSTCNMSGIARNFLYLYYRAPEHVMLDWQLQSDLINLNKLFYLLKQRRKQLIVNSTTKNPIRAARQSERLDEVLDKCSIELHARVQKLVYQQMAARNMQAVINFSGNTIEVKKTKFDLADGLIELQGLINNDVGKNHFDLNVSMKRLNVRALFAAANDFGQQAITAGNLHGRLNSAVMLHGIMSDAGRIHPGSLQGDIQFQLKAGALVNFQPFQKIGKVLFRNRGLDSVFFKDVTGHFDVSGSFIHIRPMQLESSAMNLFLEGKYGLKSGTEIFIDVPLRNPGNDTHILNDSLRQVRNLHGIVAHLKAIDDGAGSVRITLTRKGKKGKGWLPK